MAGKHDMLCRNRSVGSRDPMALHRHGRGVLKDRKGQRDGLQKLQRMKTGLIFKPKRPLHRKGKLCLDHLQSFRAEMSYNPFLAEVDEP